MVAAAKYPDPKTLYDPDPNVKLSILKVYGPSLAGVISGVACHTFMNYMKGRPYRTAFYLYPVYGAGVGFLFYSINQFLRDHYARRDQIHKHYVLQHLEDFPPPPKVKIGELLENWHPMR